MAPPTHCLQAECPLRRPVVCPVPAPSQAVAGIVGQAELWCAALSILALLLYCRAADADARGSGPQAARGEPGAGGHWRLVAGALGMACLAALSKEIGITVVGSMVLYDLLVSPHLQHQGAGSGVSAAGRRRRRLLRVCSAAAAGLLYVKMRAWVATDHLVRIYRKVRGRGVTC
jgi:hypothetical protein